MESRNNEFKLFRVVLKISFSSWFTILGVIRTFNPSVAIAPTVAFPIPADDFLDGTIDLNKHMIKEKRILFTKTNKKTAINRK